MHLLAFAYACEPNGGSEPGAGWHWARLLAHLGETWVITRSNNRDVIERALATTPERERLHFVYVDLPRRLLFWKRGRRGIQLYYLLWQVAALREARRLQRRTSFDVGWHLTLANAWVGSTASLLRIPHFVFGPVGGGVRTMWRLLPAAGARGAAGELARAATRAVATRTNLLARHSWRRASLVLTLNDETAALLPRRVRDKTVVLPNAIVEGVSPRPSRPGERAPTLLYAGVFEPRKAVPLAIRAMLHLPEWRLIIHGRGPEEAGLRRLAGELGVADRVEFAGWVERTELIRVMREDVDVFVFPSVRDQSPWTLHEARAAGLPVVCLARGGSTLLGTACVADGWPRETARALADGVLTAAAAPSPPIPDFTLASRLTVVTDALRRHGVLSADHGAHE